MYLTKPQRHALYRKYQQTPQVAPSYRDLRRRALPTIGCDGAVALPYCGMWLCIESDGYTHS